MEPDNSSDGSVGFGENSEVIPDGTEELSGGDHVYVAEPRMTLCMSDEISFGFDGDCGNEETSDVEDLYSDVDSIVSEPLSERVDVEDAPELVEEHQLVKKESSVVAETSSRKGRKIVASESMIAGNHFAILIE